MDIFYKVDGMDLPRDYARRCISEGFVGIKGCFDYSLEDCCDMSQKRFIERNWALYQFERDSTKECRARSAVSKTWYFCSPRLDSSVYILFAFSYKEVYVGHVTGGYRFVEGDRRPHQRPVKWKRKVLHSKDFSKTLLSSFYSTYFKYGIVNKKFNAELLGLLEGKPVKKQDDTAQREKTLADFRQAVSQCEWKTAPDGREYIKRIYTDSAVFEAIKKGIIALGTKDGYEMTYTVDRYRYEYRLTSDRDYAPIYRTLQRNLIPLNARPTTP